MAKYTKGHKQVSCYADGGKVEETLGTEYGAGKPTFGKAVKARLGFGDGYGKPSGRGGMSAERLYKPRTEAGKSLQSTVANRKKMLDEA